MSERFLSLNDVVALTSLSRATINRKVSAGEFAKPIKLSERRKAYREADVMAWMARQIGEAA